MEEDSQAVVLEAREAVAGALDLLHAQVEALGRTVGGPGAVVVQDLLLPALERVAEGTDLSDVVALEPTMAFLSSVRASPILSVK